VQSRQITSSEVKKKLSPGLLNPDQSQIEYVTGGAGDITFLHPFLIHGFGGESRQPNPIRLQRADLSEGAPGLGAAGRRMFFAGTLEAQGERIGGRARAVP
jgi:hypothetical protein